MKSSDKVASWKLKPVPILGGIVCAIVSSVILSAVLTQFILTGKIAYDSIEIYIYGILTISVIVGIFVSRRKQKNVVNYVLITLGFWTSLICINTVMYRELENTLPSTFALLVGLAISVNIGKKGSRAYNKKHRYR